MMMKEIGRKRIKSKRVRLGFFWAETGSVADEIRRTFRDCS